MGFSPLKNFFSTSSLDIIVFANFVEKQQQFAHSLQPRDIPCRRSLGLAKMSL
jgi:hypothetical protein